MKNNFIMARLRISQLNRLDTGFSMLEAVVVVGVLLALAVTGFFAYGPITDNAKRAAVKSAASQVYTAVMVSSADGDTSTIPQDVIDNWNASTDNIKVVILSPIAGETSANGDFCISATNSENPTITSQAGTCSDVAPGGTDGGSTDAEGNTGETEVSGAKFTPIANTNGIDPVLITYMNAGIGCDATPEFLATARADWDDATYSAYEAVPVCAQYYGMNFTALNWVAYFNLTRGSVAPLYDAFDAATNNFYNAPTAESQQAMVTAEETLYNAMVKNSIPSNLTLVAAPSDPNSLGPITVAAGSTEEITFHYALPASAGVTFTSGSLDNYDNWDPSWTSGMAVNMAGQGDNNFNAKDDNGLAVWSALIYAPDGGWQPGNNDIIATVKDNSTGYTYAAQVVIEVQ